MRKKEKWTNKGNEKHENADLHLNNTAGMPNVCTKFQKPR